MAVFVRVVEDGSFSAAAKTLDMSPSAVSKLVTRLEERLGAVLFLRSTRELTLTTEGEDFYDSARRILEDLEEAEQSVGSGSLEPSGLLRVNTSIPFGTHQLIPLLREFRERYPKVQIDLSLTDQVVDLTRERVDVAVRVGKLADASFKARALGRSHYAVVASPDYLKRYGVPDRPDQLSDHVCLGFNFKRSVSQWPFLMDGQVTALPINAGVFTNNGETMLDLVLHGVGIARLGRFHVERFLQSGQVVELLGQFNPGDVEELHAVFPIKRHMSRRVRVFIDFLAERVGPNLR
ncbi:LysR family transcriptional regulator [Roseateles terrae]|uniref:DNA-binding transcriptional LysR family regulator n=1 Tax=Roseateles terrae TaxID=431060 RepID=A0ABR6GUR8_9BURK|nr:LysR family transcriptional regulator [Roseateles terrae]MBB3195860.1 DNA-binding transcriptional LysR family regulator [Roseateles terrae]